MQKLKYLTKDDRDDKNGLLDVEIISRGYLYVNKNVVAKRCRKIWESGVLTKIEAKARKADV
jgi:hypothetical protein